MKLIRCKQFLIRRGRRDVVRLVVEELPTAAGVSIEYVDHTDDPHLADLARLRRGREQRELDLAMQVLRGSQLPRKRGCEQPFEHRSGCDQHLVADVIAAGRDCCGESRRPVVGLREVDLFEDGMDQRPQHRRLIEIDGSGLVISRS